MSSFEPERTSSHRWPASEQSLPDRHWRRRCKVNLVFVGYCYRDGPHHCGVDRTCHSVLGVWQGPRREPKPISDAYIDGLLHNDEPLDPCATHCRAESEVKPLESKRPLANIDLHRLLAQSGHWLVRCTCLLSGLKRTSHIHGCAVKLLQRSSGRFQWWWIVLL